MDGLFVVSVPIGEWLMDNLCLSENLDTTLSVQYDTLYVAM
jgi:hypothetical protein